MKKILIFYSKTGAGHLRAAQAISEHLKALDQTLQILLVDGMSINSFGREFHPDKVFLLFSSKLLFLYNFLYRFLNNTFGVWLLRIIVKLNFGKALYQVVKEFGPDLIVTTHPAINASIFNNLKSPFVTVCIDLGKPHKLWFDQKADWVIVPDHKVLNYAGKIMSQSKLAVLGYPLKTEFKIPTKTHKISNTILLLGGGAGAGNLKKQIQILSKPFPDKQFIVVCGFNQKLEQNLKSKNIPNLKVLGFIDHLPELISDCDMVLTKSGPGSVVEAAILKTPLVITSWVTMQERKNIDFVIQNSLGIYCPKVNKLPGAIRLIYKDYKKYAHGEMELAHGSDKIAGFLLELI